MVPPTANRVLRDSVSLNPVKNTSPSETAPRCTKGDPFSILVSEGTAFQMNCTRARLLGLLLVVSLATQAWAQSSGPVFPDPGKTSMSREKQEALGMEVAAQVYQQMPVLPDNSPETQYVRQLGQKLVATIPREYSWPFEFHVIPQKEINAFALPGGQMFINIGTITAAKNESELAGVMAHEMAHVYMQHSAKQASKAQTTSAIAGIASAVLGAKGGVIGQIGQMGIQMGSQGLMMKYSRGDESQADSVGAMILYRADTTRRAWSISSGRWDRRVDPRRRNSLVRTPIRQTDKKRLPSRSRAGRRRVSHPTLQVLRNYASMQRA